MAIKVDRIMSKNLVTAHWTEELNSAYNKMRRLGVRHLPVVADQGEIIGIISDRDFQRAMTYDESQPSYCLKAEFANNSLVRDFMSQPVVTVNDHMDVKTVAHLMIEKKISAVLVINRLNRAIGIVTHEDLLKMLVGILDQQDESVFEELEGIAYNSSIGTATTALAQAGV